MTSMMTATADVTRSTAMIEHRPYPVGQVTPFTEDDGRVTGHYWETSCSVAEIFAVADYVDSVIRPGGGSVEIEGCRVYVDRNLCGPTRDVNVEIVSGRTCIGAARITAGGEAIVTVAEPVDYVAIPADSPCKCTHRCTCDDAA
jgi:hypothetical protein